MCSAHISRCKRIGNKDRSGDSISQPSKVTTGDGEGEKGPGLPPNGLYFVFTLRSLLAGVESELVVRPREPIKFVGAFPASDACTTELEQNFEDKVALSLPSPSVRGGRLAQTCEQTCDKHGKRVGICLWSLVTWYEPVLFRLFAASISRGAINND